MCKLGHRLILLLFAVFSLATASYSQASEGVSPDMCYSFKEDGSFAGKVLVPGVSNSLVLSQKGIAEPIVARFADPVNDPLQIDSSTKAVLVDRNFIRTALKKAGVYKGLLEFHKDCTQEGRSLQGPSPRSSSWFFVSDIQKQLRRGTGLC